MKAFFFATIIYTLLLSSAEAYNYLNDRVYLFVPSFHVRGGAGRSYQQGYQAVEGFLSQFNPSTGNSTYLDVDLLRVGDGRLALNSALGFRHFSPNYRNMIGAYIGYDYRNSHRHNFSQVGLGMEWLTGSFQLRLNGYIPFSNKNVLLDTTTLNYTPPYFAFGNHYLSPMWGVDFEAGKILFARSNRFKLYAGIGPYYYASRGFDGTTIFGGMGRITASLWRYLNLNFYITYDRDFRFKPQGEISLYIPFSTFCNRWRCIFTPLYRNRVIITQEYCCWKTNF